MNLSKLKIDDYVVVLDGTVAKVIDISQTDTGFHLYFDREIIGEKNYTSTDWFYTKKGLWGYRPGVGNDIVKILEVKDG